MRKAGATGNLSKVSQAGLFLRRTKAAGSGAMPKESSRYSQNAHAVVVTSAFNGRGEQLIGTMWRESP